MLQIRDPVFHFIICILGKRDGVVGPAVWNRYCIQQLVIYTIIFIFNLMSIMLCRLCFQASESVIFQLFYSSQSGKSVRTWSLSLEVLFLMLLIGDETFFSGLLYSVSAVICILFVRKIKSVSLISFFTFYFTLSPLFWGDFHNRVIWVFGVHGIWKIWEHL